MNYPPATDIVFCAILTFVLHRKFLRLVSLFKLVTLFCFKLGTSFSISLFFLAVWKLRHLNTQFIVQAIKDAIRTASSSTGE
jgi:hypothetical protein